MTIFYDFNIVPNSEVIETLEHFKFKGACIFYNSHRYYEEKEEIEKSFNSLNESTTLDLYHGIVINETNPQLLRKEVQRFFKKVDLIMANGGDEKINRTICETPQIDIINHPYLHKRNSGINHVLSKLLVENNISVNINLNDILQHRGYYKSKILNQINQMLMLQRKYGFRTILSSGSTSFYDVRSPKSMILLSQLMDMNTDYANKCLSDNPKEIIENITIHKESIVEGVRIIKD
jgi:ribonuclease P/MRP protein subunit RPP1